MAPSSAVWLYCTKNRGSQEATCNICKKSFSFLGSTSTLITHLEKLHKISIPKLTSKSVKRKRDQSEDGSNLDDSPLVDVNKNAGGMYQSDTQSASTSKPQSDKCMARHGTLEDSWNEMNSFQEGGTRYKEVTDAMLFMIAHDNMPLRTPERTGFRVFCKRLNPRYRVPCENTTTKALHKKYLKLRDLIKEELGKTENVTLTLDIWTNKHTVQSFLGITAHFMKESQMRSIELTAKLLTGRKTIENLKEVIESCCNEWNMNSKKVIAAVTDGGHNIKGAVKAVFGETKHISCFGHILNLIGTKAIGLYDKKTRPSEIEDSEVDPDVPERESDIDDEEDITVEARGMQTSGSCNNISGVLLADLLRKVKKIVTFFKHSEIATSELMKIQMEGANEKENKALKLIQECRTRWNSAYEMVERFLQLYDFVARAIMKVQREKSARKKPPNMLTIEELETLIEVRDLLKPLAQATAEVSTEKTVSISKVIPLVNLMKKKIQNFSAASPIGFNLKEQLLLDIRHHFGKIEFVKTYAVATLIDPRFKKLPFSHIRAVADAVSYTSELMRVKMGANAANEMCENAAALPSPESSMNDDDLWNSLDTEVRANRQARQS